MRRSSLNTRSFSVEPFVSCAPPDRNEGMPFDEHAPAKFLLTAEN
jgi:hypothetical protein